MTSIRRRGSLASLDSTCLVAKCQLASVRRGGYCVYHTNQFATGTSAAAIDPKSPEVVCLGASCQGHIKGGYCARHRQLGDIGDFTDLSMPATAELHDRRKKQSNKKSPSLVENQLGGASAAGNANPNNPKGMVILQQFLDGLHNIFSEVLPHRASEMIIKEACKILECERATLFYVDGDELVLMIAKGAKNIRLPKSKGIAGYVASTGHTVKIDDAYAESRFDPSFDKQSGFRTRNILATPVVDQEGAVIAVLQVINKITEDGSAASFIQNDVLLIEALAFHCGVSLRNAQMFEQLQRSENKISSLIEIIQMLSMGPSLNSLIFTLSSRAPTLVECDRCTLYLTDRVREQLVVMTGDVDIRIPLNKGIAGYCATSGKIVNIPDCYKDERFNPDIDKQTGYRTRTMLCMPIPGDETNEIIGVLQLINRNDEETFQSADESILTTLLSIAGPILKKSSFFHLQKEKMKISPNESAPLEIFARPRGSSREHRDVIGIAHSVAIGGGSISPIQRARSKTSGGTPTMALKRLPELPE